MQLTVLIEPVSGNRFRATISESLGFVAEGPTREEALRNLRQLIEARLVAGAQLTRLEVGPPLRPWSRFAGIWKDDPLIDEWQREVEEYRREMDEDPTVR